jgi:hypothetical protein
MHALRALASHHLVALALELLDWRHAARARLARLPQQPQPQPPQSTHARTERALLAAVSALEAAQQQNAQQGAQQPQQQFVVTDQHSLQQQPARMTAAQRAWAAAIDIVVGQALLVAFTNLTSAASSAATNASSSAVSAVTTASNTVISANATALPLPLALAIEAIGCAWIDASVGVRVVLHRSNAGSSSSSASSSASNAVALAPSSSASASASASLPPRSARRQSERLVFHVWSELVCLTRAAHSDSLATRWLHRIEDAGAANASTGAASAAASVAASVSQDPSLSSSSSSSSSALVASLALPLSPPASIDVALRRLRALCFVELDLRHTDGLRHVASDAVSRGHQAWRNISNQYASLTHSAKLFLS